MDFKIEQVKGVGVKTQETFNKNDIFTTHDLLENYPKRYLHFAEHENLTFKNHNEMVSINVEIKSELSINQFSNAKVIKFVVTLNENDINVVAFNQMYLTKILKKNSFIFITGKYNYYKNEIILSKISSNDNFKNIVPKYNIESILDTNITKIITNIFNEEKHNIKDNLPLYIINKYNLINRYQMIK